MMFEYTVMAVSLVIAIASVVALKLALPDATSKEASLHHSDSSHLGYGDTVRFLLKRMTLVEVLTVRKSIHKISHLFFLGILMLVSSVMPSVVYWGWAMGTVLSAGFYLILDVSMEDKQCSPQNTSWKRSLMYSIMVFTAVCCSLIGSFVVGFTDVDPVSFVKSVVISLTIDQILSRPIMILALSLVLKDSMKTRRLMARYQYIQACCTNKVAAVEQVSNQVILNYKVNTFPLGDILNVQTALPRHPNKVHDIAIDSRDLEILNDSVHNNKRPNRLRSRAHLPAMLAESKQDKENSNLFSPIRRTLKSPRIRRGTKDNNITESHLAEHSQRSSADKQVKEEPVTISALQTGQHHNNGPKRQISLVSKGSSKSGEENSSRIQLLQRTSSHKKGEAVVDDVYKFDSIHQKGGEESQCGVVEGIGGVNLDQLKFCQVIADLGQVKMNNLENEYNSIQVARTVVFKEPSLQESQHGVTQQGLNQFLPEVASSIIHQSIRTPSLDLRFKNSSLFLEPFQDAEYNNQRETKKGNQKPDNQDQLQVFDFNRSRVQRKLNIFNDSMSDVVDYVQLQRRGKSQDTSFNHNRDKSKHLNVVDADQSEFDQQSTPKKTRSNSQDPSRPMKYMKGIKHNSSEASALKKSILEVRESNHRIDDIQHIDLNTIDLARISENKSKANSGRKVYKRKNFKTLFKGDSPYLEYLPNMLTKEIKNQFSNKKSKQNLIDLHHEKYKQSGGRVSRTSPIKQL